MRSYYLNLSINNHGTINTAHFLVNSSNEKDRAISTKWRNQKYITMKYLITTLLLISIITETIFPGIINSIILLIMGGTSIYWFLTRSFLMQKEINILKEENMYFIDSFQDLRTPITFIQTPLKEVCDKECPSHIKDELLLAISNIECVNDHLTRLINMKQLFIQPESMNMAEFELGNFLKKRLYSLKGHAANKQVKLEIETGFNFASTWFDQSKISPIVEKFIKNAIDHGEAKKSITFSVSVSTEYWEIKTTDSENGELMNCYKAKKQNLLNLNSEIKYYFAESTLCKELIEKCNGKISVDNSHHSVSLQFPIKCEHENCIQRTPMLIEENHKEEQTDTLFGKNKKRNSSKPTVILADSNEDFRSYLEARLANEYIVKSFSTGPEVLASIADEHPDLLLCDSVLHEMSGDELSSRLKTSGDTSLIPIILYGSHIDSEQRFRREASLADAFLYLPFHMEDLKIEMAVQIKSSRLLRRSFLQKIFGEQFLETPMDEKKSDTKMAFINEVKEYILKNLTNEKLTIDEIAAQHCMSRTSFYNHWKSITGEAPKYIIEQIRLEKAYELLESGKYQVNEVPEMIGLKSVDNFREKYKKHFGVRPSDTKNI